MRPSPVRSILPAAVLGALLAVSAMAQAAPRHVALLVGVGAFANPRIPALEGPAWDVAALKDVLVRRWGFEPADVRTLIGKEGTRERILAELAALMGRSASGDEILVYLSGHGTSALDADAGIAVPQGSGAFVPSDYRPGAPIEESGLIVGRTDLRPVLGALEAAGRRLWVVSDSCYSGQLVRAVRLGDPGALPSRALPAPLGPSIPAQRATLARAVQASPLEPYPYRGTAYLSASSEGEVARDIPRGALDRMPTLDGRPHGAFTDALLRVLDAQIPADLDGDGLLSLNEAHRAVSDFMDQRAYGQSPQRLPSVAEDAAGLGNRPVLDGRGVALRASGQPPLALRVRVEPGAPGLERAVAGVDGVRRVGADDPADVILRVDGARLAILAASGDLLAAMPAADSARARRQLLQLAWARRLRGLAEQYRHGALAAEPSPARFGGNFVLGGRVTFLVRPERASTLVLLDIDAEGRVSVLWPTSAAEDAPLLAGQARRVPGDGPDDAIEVREPLGMDEQLIFAFDEPPPGLARLHDATGIDPDDPRLVAFERLLAQRAGRFSFAATRLRTLSP